MLSSERKLSTQNSALLPPSRFSRMSRVSCANQAAIFECGDECSCGFSPSCGSDKGVSSNRLTPESWPSSKQSRTIIQMIPTSPVNSPTMSISKNICAMARFLSSTDHSSDTQCSASRMPNVKRARSLSRSLTFQGIASERHHRQQDGSRSI